MAATTVRSHIARRTTSFTESVIREMTRLINLHHPDDGINLAQGFPDFAAPDAVKKAAQDAIGADINQYAVTWGTPALRWGIAEKTKMFYAWEPDPETEITVTCGSTEAMISSMLAVVNPGEEIVVFEPLYENYGPDCILCDAIPRVIKLQPPDWTFDRDELAGLFNQNTRAIIINTPNNPTGKVFTRDELEFIAQLCKQFDALAITDEIYEHMVYDGLTHIPIARLPGMSERTITINGLSKTFSITGWRIGYIIAPESITAAIRKVHDFLTVGAPAPLQEGGVAAVNSPPAYYTQLCEDYRERRDFIIPVLQSVGFAVTNPSGAYYTMADISHLGFSTDVAFADWLVREVGIAVVPGSSFYGTAGDGAHLVRFAFPKKMSTLERAAERLATLTERLPSPRP